MADGAKGRWDIYYIKNPKRPETKITKAYDVASLIVVAETHPESWEELKDLIATVDSILQEED